MIINTRKIYKLIITLLPRFATGSSHCLGYLACDVLKLILGRDGDNEDRAPLL